jgi:hypothetical protein
LQIAEIQLAIFEYISDDRRSLANAARVNSAWWSLAVPHLWYHVDESILARVPGNQRQQLYANHIRTICVKSCPNDDGNVVDGGLRFPRLACLNVGLRTYIRQYERFLQPSLTEFSLFSPPSPQLGRVLANNCPRLSCVTLHYFDKELNHCRAVALLLTVFAGCPASLTSIELGCRLPDCPALRELFQCWARLPLLQELDTSYEADGAGFEAAARLLPDLPNGDVSFPSLRRLRIHLRTGRAEHLVAAAPFLTHLDLTVNMGDSFVLAALAPLTQLRELIMRYNSPAHPLTPRNVAALQRLGQLRLLCLFALPPDGDGVSGEQQHGVSFVTDADISSLAAALPHLVLLRISVGTCAANFMTGAALRSIGEHCRHLTTLALDGKWDMSCWRQSPKTPLFPRLQSLSLHDLVVRGGFDHESR